MHSQSRSVGVITITHSPVHRLMLVESMGSAAVTEIPNSSE